MSFEPQKFFIGLIDFFAILMPGALVTYLGRDRAAWVLLDHKAQSLDGTEAWLVFLFASYLLGHFIFLAGAWLDDLLYDPLRKCTAWGQIRRLAAKKELSPPQWRTLAEWVFRKFPDRAVVQVERIKARALQSVSDEANDAINAFQWSKARLSKDNPEGLAAVQRFEADSKFFRSFVVVLTPLVIVLPFIGRPIPAAVVAALLLPALWRYADQRFKATQQAYWHVITLEVATEPGATRATSSGSDDVTHAGGLISRIRCGPAKAGGIAGRVHEYLLVEAKKKPVELVLPKGHIEPGEESSVTAVREVLEETGQPARLIDLFKDVRLGKDDATPLTRLWRMSPVEDRSDASIAWRRENRQVRWLALEDEEIGRCFPETVKVLKEAEEMRAALKPPKPAATSEAATDGVAALPVRSNG